MDLRGFLEYFRGTQTLDSTKETMMTKTTQLWAEQIPLSVEADTLYRLTIPVSGQGLKPVVDEDSGDVTFWTVAVDCDSTPNRRGLIFDWPTVESVKVGNFLKNPAMLYAHDSESLPVGRWERVEVTPRQVRLFGRIPGGAEYADVQPLRVRVRDGYLKAVSIGFYITESEEIRDKDGRVVAVKVREFELVECSPCAIGAHPSAIIGQSEKGKAVQHSHSEESARQSRDDDVGISNRANCAYRDEREEIATSPCPPSMASRNDVHTLSPDLADTTSPDSSSAPALADAGRDLEVVRAAEGVVRRFIRRVLRTDPDARRARDLMALTRVGATALKNSLRRKNSHV
jgi:HK97 family phage prohead protease